MKFIACRYYTPQIAKTSFDVMKLGVAIKMLHDIAHLINQY